MHLQYAAATQTDCGKLHISKGLAFEHLELEHTYIGNY